MVAVTPPKGSGSEHRRPRYQAPTHTTPAAGESHPVCQAPVAAGEQRAPPDVPAPTSSPPSPPSFPQEEDGPWDWTHRQSLDVPAAGDPHPPDVVDGYVLSDRDKRAWVRDFKRGQQQRKEQRAHQDREQQLQALARANEASSSGEEDIVSQIPVHQNRFDVLPSETVDVDVTGYTGKEHEGGSAGGTEPATDWDQNEVFTDPVAEVCHIQRRWIGGIPSGRTSGIRVSLRQKSSRPEGVLKVRFDEVPVVHWYVHVEEEMVPMQKAWYRPVSSMLSRVSPSVVQKTLQSGRKGATVLSVRKSSAGDAPSVVSEEVSGVFDSGEAAPPIPPVSRYAGGAREEAFLHRIFERESAPFVFAVMDTEGLKHQSPKTLREARLSPQWPQWQQACNDEVSSIEKHHTYSLVNRPPDKRVLPTHWVLTPKVDGDGVVYRRKARLVVNGDRQRSGIDVKETFAPTATAAARRTQLSLAAERNYEIHQADIKTAFLHGELEEEVYVEQPPGFGNGNPNLVWRLHRSLYGLKQAPRCWWKKLTEELRTLGFHPCMSDSGIYVNMSTPDCPVYLGVFVDDMIIVTPQVAAVEQFKGQLTKLFEIHDLGEVKDFLGASIIRDREERVLYMRNTAKIDEYVESFGLGSETQRVRCPMSQSFLPTIKPHLVVPATQLASEIKEGAGVPLEAGNRFGELVGCLMYIANQTRPDISTAVGILSQFRAAPTTSHWNEGLRILRYLKDTRLYALRLGGGGPVLEAYTDADYGGCKDTYRSRSGFLVKVLGGVVSWGSKKQKILSTCTVDSEFVAASLAIKEVIWLRGLLTELGVKVGKVNLVCDNNGCLSHLRDPLISGATKHSAIRFHFAREAVDDGQVVPGYVGTDDNIADIFTKPLPPVVFEKHREGLGVVPLPPHLLKGKC